MIRWEYCEAIWRPDVVELTMPTPDEAPPAASYPTAQWLQVLAQLGVEGWEMTGVAPSATSAHEYFFYFKRPFEG